MASAVIVTQVESVTLTMSHAETKAVFNVLGAEPAHGPTQSVYDALENALPN